MILHLDQEKKYGGNVLKERTMFGVLVLRIGQKEDKDVLFAEIHLLHLS